MNETWSDETRNRWFYGALALSTVLVAVLFWPFAYTLMFAVVTVVVTWPVHSWMKRKVGENRPATAAALTALLLFLLVFGPIATVLYLFALEAAQVWGQLQNAMEAGDVEEWLVRVRDEELGIAREWLDRWLGDYLPEDADLIGAAFERVQGLVMSTINTGAKSVLDLLGATATSVVQALIFVFAVISLYMEGPRVLQALKHLSPMEDDYEDRLFEVFREFAYNMVLGSIVSGALQGVVAGIGYSLAGVERVVFLGLLTGVFSFIPLVGTAVVWVPVAVGLLLTQGIGPAAFVAVWSMVFTTSVDNVVKPLMLRGRTKIHPLLIFLAVFGGLWWMGVPGVLVGPVVVAFFLALYHMYVRDHLGIDLPAPLRTEPVLPAWLRRLLPGVSEEDTPLTPEPPGEDSAEPTDSEG